MRPKTVIILALTVALAACAMQTSLLPTSLTPPKDEDIVSIEYLHTGAMPPWKDQAETEPYSTEGYFYPDGTARKVVRAYARNILSDQTYDLGKSAFADYCEYLKTSGFYELPEKINFGPFDGGFPCLTVNTKTASYSSLWIPGGYDATENAEQNYKKLNEICDKFWQTIKT